MHASSAEGWYKGGETGGVPREIIAPKKTLEDSKRRWMKGPSGVKLAPAAMRQHQAETGEPAGISRAVAVGSAARRGVQVRCESLRAGSFAPNLPSGVLVVRAETPIGLVMLASRSRDCPGWPDDGGMRVAHFCPQASCDQICWNPTNCRMRQVRIRAVAAVDAAPDEPLCTP